MAGNASPEGGRYERRDTDVSTLTWLLLALLAATLVALVLMKVLYGHFASREEARQPAPSTLAGARSGVPPEPRLQNRPFDDLRRLRAEEDAALATYGWVDRKAGIVRIPIEKALEIAARGGLPAEPAPADPEAPGGGKR